MLGGNGERARSAGSLAVAGRRRGRASSARLDRDRRATTWIGVLAVFGGLVAILADIAPDSEAGVGGIALGFAVALGAIAWWLAPMLGEPDDGDDDRSPDPTPPGGDTRPLPTSRADATRRCHRRGCSLSGRTRA